MNVDNDFILQAAADAGSQKPYCKPCKKAFATQMAYDNHVKSNKHVEKTIKYAEGKTVSYLLGKPLSVHE